MVRRVFFCFHYERDIWRASVVRNSWGTKPDRETTGFIDAANWEELKRKGEDAVLHWIDDQLQGTSVTVVLIGAETSERKYVVEEIKKSYERGNGQLGIYIHNLKNEKGETDSKGKNPFDNLYIEKKRQKVYFSRIFSTYNWVIDEGYNNFAEWLEKADQKAWK